MRLWFWSFVVVGSLASLGLFWLTATPLGVPGEWSWGRHEITLDLAANLMLGLIAGVVYLTFVWCGTQRLARLECRRIESLDWQLGLALLAAGWTFLPLGFGTNGATAGRWPFVVFYRASSGYFFKARYESPDAKEFLRGYESLMKEGDVLHTGTHPPGLFLFFHGLIGVVDRNPSWISTINDTQPAAVQEAFNLIKERWEPLVVGHSPDYQLTTADRAVLWLACLVGLALAAATVWPLYGFLRLDFDRPASWLIASAWPLVPAIGVFLPKSDVAFAFFAMLTACLWRCAWRRSNIVLAMLAGAVWTIGILCSLAFLPVALWLALMSLFDSWPAIRRGERRQELARGLRTILPAGVNFFAMMGLLAWWGEIAIWNVYWWNYHNHAGFYRQYPRTYFAWLAVNPLELLGAAGAPLLVAACFGIVSELRRWQSGTASLLLSPCLATVIVWSWLWLSGKNAGEAARLWTFLLPFMVICAAANWLPKNDGRSEREYFSWLILQAAVCLLTVQRVNGFPL